MAKNTIETIWKLILDKGEAKEGESLIMRLSRALKEKFGREGTKAIDETTAALERQNKQLKENEDQAKKTAKATGESGGKGGGNAPSPMKFRGAASLFGGGGAGEALGILDDISDAVEGIQQLRGSLKDLPSSASGAASALGTAGLIGAISAAAFAISKIQEKIAADTAKAQGIIGEIQDAAAFAATHTTEEIKAEIAAEEERVKGLEASKAAAEAVLKPLEDHVAAMKPLERAHLEFNTAIGTGGAELKAARQAADGANQALTEGNTRLDALRGTLDDAAVAANDAAAAEEKLAAERTQATLESAAAAGAEVAARKRADDASYEQNQARIDSIEDERAAIEAQLAVLKSSGDTSEAVADQIAKLTAQLGALGSESDYIKNSALSASKARDDAKKAADDQKKAEEQAQRDAEQADRDAEAAEQKRLESARQYSDKLVDIAQAAADYTDKLANGLKEKLAANQADTLQDIADIGAEFHASEREEAIQRAEEDAKDAREHAKQLRAIRDNAFAEEKDLERKRDFLGATKVRERAIAEQEAEIKAFREGQDEKILAQKSEDSAQLRELDKTRRERMNLLQRANNEANQAYQRDIQNQREARRIAEREAKVSFDRQNRMAVEFTRAALGIKSQQSVAELALARQTLDGIRGLMTVNNNNNSRTINGGVHVGISGAGISGQGISGQGIAAEVLSVLGKVGFLEG